MSNCKRSGCDGKVSFCEMCDDGFYLEGGQCIACSKAMPFCSKCSNKEKCLECSNSLVMIDGGKCLCREDNKGVKRNNSTGFCECTDNSKYLTENGCFDCGYL